MTLEVVEPTVRGMTMAMAMAVVVDKVVVWREEIAVDGQTEMSGLRLDSKIMSSFNVY